MLSDQQHIPLSNDGSSKRCHAGNLQHRAGTWWAWLFCGSSVQTFLSYIVRIFLHVFLNLSTNFCWLNTCPCVQVAMECAAAAGCDDSIVKFVLPLGTTVNMNGTALWALLYLSTALQHNICLNVDLMLWGPSTHNINWIPCLPKPEFHSSRLSKVSAFIWIRCYGFLLQRQQRPGILFTTSAPSRGT